MKKHSASLLAMIAALGLGGAVLAQTSTGGTAGTGTTGTGTTTVVPQQQPSAGEDTSGSGQTTTGTTQAQQPSTMPSDTTGSTSGSTMDQPAATAGASGAMGQGILASSLIGMTVYSASGEQIGEVNDIVVRPQTGKANTAIIGVGGFLGIGEKDVAIDMAQMQMVREADDATPRLTLNTAKDQLNAAPSFDRNALRNSQSTTGSTTGTGTQTDQPQQ